MRNYNDPERTRSLGDIYEMGQRDAERNNPAIQIVQGLSRMQDNIKNIRLARQQKGLMDQAVEIKKKENTLALEKAEMMLGPDAVAGRKEEMKLHFTKQKAESAIADRQLQRAQLSEEENFKNSVNFIKQLGQQTQGEDLFGMVPSIGKDGTYQLSPRSVASQTVPSTIQRNKAAAFKDKVSAAMDMSKDSLGNVDEEKFQTTLKQLQLDELGSATTTPKYKVGQIQKANNGKNYKYLGNDQWEEQ